MSNFLRRCILLFAILAVARVAVPAAESADVVILIGQSNMDGRGAVKYLPPDLQAPNPAFQIFYRNPPFSSEGWKPLAPGFSVPPGYKGTTLPSGTFGCELTFAPALAKLRPDLHLVLIKASKGGTSLNKDWKPATRDEVANQGPCYRNFRTTLTDALAALPGTGHRLRGVVWHQGESDAGMPAEAYGKMLTTFIARVREDLATPDLPFVIGEVYDNGNRDFVRAGQKDVGSTVPKTAFVSCEGLVTFDKGTHFDAAGQMEFGRRYATALAGLLPHP